jgi:DNA (cytosine-5)-methyltransferase 1
MLQKRKIPTSFHWTREGERRIYMYMKSIELFSGAGGMALGLDQAGFESVALYEWNARACQALRHNRPSWNIVNGDVRDVDFSTWGHVDLVAGGPPCSLSPWVEKRVGIVTPVTCFHRRCVRCVSFNHPRFYSRM